MQNAVGFFEKSLSLHVLLKPTMKKLVLIIVCITVALRCLPQEPDTLSPKDRIFYHYDRSEFTDVVRCCNEALKGYQATDDLFEMAGCYNILGIAYQRLGKFKEAIESYELCTQTMERLKNSEYELHQEGAAAFYDKSIRYTRNNMAEIYFAMGDYGESEKLYLKCLEMLGKPIDTIDYLDQALYLENLSIVGLKQAATLEGTEKVERLSTSAEQAEQAVSLSTQYGDPPFKRVSKSITLAQAYHAVGRVSESLSLMERALDEVQDVEDPYLLAEIHSVYGEFEAEAGRYEAAESHYGQAVTLATEHHFDELKYASLTGAYEAAQHFDKALAFDYLLQCDAIKDSLFDEEQQHLIRDYQVQYDTQAKENQIALQEQANKANRQRIILLLLLAALLLVLLAVGFRLGVKRKRQNKMLAKLNRDKDHLISVVSHDFKTSVVSQSMMLDAMNQFYDDMTAEQVKDKLLTLKASADALKGKMFNLFEWIKVELGSSQTKNVPFDLRKTVGECVAANATEIAQKSLNLVVDVDEMNAYGNPTVVRLVLQNLLSNAIKFSWPQGDIKVSATKEGNRIWVTVEDHGTGMTPDRRDALMKDVVKPSQGTRNESGTGIGLMLCRSLLDQNGGEITMESQESLGTTVRFSIATA